ncbi:transcriptional regulator with XRE-family HTH domain [Nocardiopsis mwathae]|uniref:Transcriptional regulator with XRE-family HTH domain n=1 Tax=Nocardiopsis mwathae TaxID=1472723 RepID=A0A7W9YHW0_9ACTN|nr:helix-turn-helix transcriptional regulator [Nocardiopsis mwathae]MBB6172260.1 transcriptional regulator with XRE-family HTH domain [Nocardiopsis mwathae]
MMPTDPPPQPHHRSPEAQRLDHHLNASRERQGLSWAAFARKGGISEEALRYIRTGERKARQSSIERIERAAGWAPGGFEDALNGRTPRPAQPSDHYKIEQVAERLVFLFNNVRKDKHGNLHTPEEVSEALARTKLEVSPTDLDNIMTAAKEAPLLSNEALEGIARVFKVDKSYFTDDHVAESVRSQIRFVNRLQDEGVQQIAMRTEGLSDQSRQLIIGMLDRAREAEGLPKIENNE